MVVRREFASTTMTLTGPMNSASMTRTRRGLLTNEPLILLALVLLGLYFAREVLIPLAMALTLNFLLTPAVMFFERRRLKRVSSVVLWSL